jgi:hypothetical protein
MAEFGVNELKPFGHFEQWSFLLISSKSVRTGISQRDSGGRIGRYEAEDRLVWAA